MTILDSYLDGHSSDVVRGQVDRCVLEWVSSWHADWGVLEELDIALLNIHR